MRDGDDCLVGWNLVGLHQKVPMTPSPKTWAYIGLSRVLGMPDDLSIRHKKYQLQI